MLSLDPRVLILRITAILFILTVHEYFHAWAAYRIGDPTAKMLGRVSLNPLRHLDILGTVMLLFGPFGWGKPVPVDPRNFRNPVRDNMIVSFAGPGSSLALGMLFGLGVRGVTALTAMLPFDSGWGPYLTTAHAFFQISTVIGIALGFFNLLPFFPLDGAHVFRGLVPRTWRPEYDRYLSVSQFILLALLIIPWLTGRPFVLQWVLYPLVASVYALAVGGAAAAL